MDIKKINDYKVAFDGILQYITSDDGKEEVEVWFARDLQKQLGYARWENFAVASGRAVESCKSQNINVDDHFREVTKMVSLGSGSQREVQDYMLTRFACYYNVGQKDLYGERSITAEHVQNNRSVRQMLGQRGIKPEDLPAAEDIKKVERRVANDQKNIEKTSDKLPSKDNGEPA